LIFIGGVAGGEERGKKVTTLIFPETEGKEGSPPTTTAAVNKIDKKKKAVTSMEQREKCSPWAACFDDLQSTAGQENEKVSRSTSNPSGVSGRSAGPTGEKERRPAS